MSRFRSFVLYGVPTVLVMAAIGVAIYQIEQPYVKPGRFLKPTFPEAGASFEIVEPYVVAETLEDLDLSIDPDVRADENGVERLVQKGDLEMLSIGDRIEVLEMVKGDDQMVRARIRAPQGERWTFGTNVNTRLRSKPLN